MNSAADFTDLVPPFQPSKVQTFTSGNINTGASGSKNMINTDGKQGNAEVAAEGEDEDDEDVLAPLHEPFNRSNVDQSEMMDNFQILHSPFISSETALVGGNRG